MSFCKVSFFSLALLFSLLLPAAGSSLLAADVEGVAGTEQVSASQELISLSGFGTIATTRTDNSSRGYRVYPQSSYKANEWAWDTDSKLGVQMDIASGRDLSATVQVIGKKRETSRWDPQIEWAFLSWKITPEWRLRVGRVLTPAFMESDYRFVSYALIPVRPQAEVYGVFPLSSHDGFDLRYQTAVASGLLSLTAYGGSSTLGLPRFGGLPIAVDADRTLGGVMAWDNDEVLIRIGHLVSDAHYSGQGTAAFRNFRTGLDAAAAAVGCGQCAEQSRLISNQLTNGHFSLTNIGTRVRLGNWMVWGEAQRGQWDSVIASGNGALFGLSRRSGAWTPYAIVSAQRVTKQGDPSVIPPAAIAAVPSLRAFTAALAAQQTGRDALTVGVRWDYSENVALKAELAHYQLKSATANVGVFPANPQPAAGQVPTAGDRFNLLSLSMDFVF